MNKMKHYRDAAFKEEYYEEQFDSGLTVIYYPKNDFETTLGILSVNYGSIDQTFLENDTRVTTPLGVAHFLEHKMFEISKEVDAATLFSNWGVDSNAFTSYDHTAYYFTGVTHAEDSLRLLIQFVLNHSFDSSIESNKSIKKEIGIISEELKMYLDDEQSAMHMGLLKAIYKTNPVRLEIGGTLSSIQKIDVTELSSCYRRFYQESNMVLVLIGKLDKDKMHDIISSELSKLPLVPQDKITRILSQDEGITTPFTSKEYMEVASPMVGIALSFPTRDLTSLERLKKQFAVDIISDIFFDKASDNYKELIKARLIDYSFDYGIYFEATYGFITLQSNTKNVDKTLEEFKKCLSFVSQKEVDEHTFSKYKKIQQARLIRKLSDLEYVANLIVELKLVNVNLFDYLKLLEELSLADIRECQKYFLSKAYGIHIILPNEQKENNSLNE